MAASENSLAKTEPSGQDANDPVWSADANDATALGTGADLDLGGLAVPKGDYTVFINLAGPTTTGS